MILTAAAAAATQPDSGWAAKVAVALFGLIAAAFLLDRVGLWMEKRGWIYWRQKKRDTGGGGAMAGMLTGFQKIIEPQIEHRQQVMEERNEAIGQRLGRGDDIDHPVRQSDEDEKKEVR
jgi:hypothetical protein